MNPEQLQNCEENFWRCSKKIQENIETDNWSDAKKNLEKMVKIYSEISDPNQDVKVFIKLKKEITKFENLFAQWHLPTRFENAIKKRDTKSAVTLLRTIAEQAERAKDQAVLDDLPRMIKKLMDVGFRNSIDLAWKAVSSQRKIVTNTDMDYLDTAAKYAEKSNDPEKNLSEIARCRKAHAEALITHHLAKRKKKKI